MDGSECDAPALADLHVWLLFVADDPLMSESKVRLQKQLDTLQQFCVERELYDERGKNKSHGVQFC